MRIILSSNKQHSKQKGDNMQAVEEKASASPATNRRKKRTNTEATEIAKTPANPEFVKLSQFAAMFQMSLSGVHKAIAAGNLAYIEIPGEGEDKVSRRIPWSEVERIRKPIRQRKAST